MPPAGPQALDEKPASCPSRHSRCARPSSYPRGVQRPSGLYPQGPLATFSSQLVIPCLCQQAIRCYKSLNMFFLRNSTYHIVLSLYPLKRSASSETARELSRSSPLPDGSPRTSPRTLSRYVHSLSKHAPRRSATSLYVENIQKFWLPSSNDRTSSSRPSGRSSGCWRRARVLTTETSTRASRMRNTQSSSAKITWPSTRKFSRRLSSAWTAKSRRSRRSAVALLRPSPPRFVYMARASGCRSLFRNSRSKIL